MIRLYENAYPGGNYGWNSSPIQFLAEASKCIITEDIEGTFELEAEWPLASKEVELLKCRRVLEVYGIPRKIRTIKAATQAFRIQSVDKDYDSGVASVYAVALACDLKFQYICAGSEMVAAMKNGVSYSRLSNLTSEIVSLYTSNHGTANLRAPFTINFDAGFPGAPEEIEDGPLSIIDWLLHYKKQHDNKYGMQAALFYNNYDLYISFVTGYTGNPVQIKQNQIAEEIEDISDIFTFARAWWSDGTGSSIVRSTFSNFMAPNLYYRELAFNYNDDYSSAPSLATINNKLADDIANLDLNNQESSVLKLRNTSFTFQPDYRFKFYMPNGKYISKITITGYKYDVINGKFLEQTFNGLNTMFKN